MPSHPVSSHRHHLDDRMSPEQQRLDRLMARAAKLVVDAANGNETKARCQADALAAVLASYVVQEIRRQGREG